MTVHTKPLNISQNNTFEVGDVVSCVHANGVGEGVLWSVVKVEAKWIWIEPAYCVTGKSVLRRKKLPWYGVKGWETTDLCLARIKLDNLIRRDALTTDFIDLCSARARLDAVINDIVKQRSEEADTET